MSVFKRSGAKTYSYDFILGGIRFSGNTGETEQREAKREEKRLKAIARDNNARILVSSDANFEAVALKWMFEVGQHHKNALSCLRDVERLVERVGPRTRVSQIDDRLVARVVATRREDLRAVGNGKTEQRRVSNTTVNRSTTELLRKILRRAEKIYKLAVQDITWSAHMLKEPKERVREASVGEEQRLFRHLTTGYDVAVHFAIMSGCRLDEIVKLTWEDIDIEGRQFTVTGKNDSVRTIPMSQALFNLLSAEQGHHPTKVFTYEAQRTDRRKGLLAGQRYPMTYYGLQIAMRRAVKLAGLVNLRFHDLRHTAATRTLRKSNLRVVQHLLGHADVTTTAKYAHAQAEDIRAALDAVSPTQSPSDFAETNVKSLKDRA